MQDNPHDLPIEHIERQNGSNMQIFDDKGSTNKFQKYNFQRRHSPSSIKVKQSLSKKILRVSHSSSTRDIR